MKIGVDLGGTRLHVALIKDNKIIKEIRTTHKQKNREYILKQLTENIEKLFNKNIKGIAIGVAGIIKSGRCIDLPNLPSLNNVNLKKIISRKFKVKTLIENDVNCFAVRQQMHYKAKNLVCLTLGTGVGGGIVINSRLYKGGGFAGEIGHMVIREGGLKEAGGRQGTLEAYCSGTAIEKRYYNLTKKRKKVIEIAKLKTKADRKIINETGYYLGIGLANIVNILNPEIIVIGGGVSNVKGLFSVAEKEMKKRILKGVNVKVVRNKLEGSTAIGAVRLLG